MPSGYELCTLFIDRVVKHLPKDISNSLIDAFVSRVTAHEENEFFSGEKSVIDDWYRGQTEVLRLQGIAKANALPKTGMVTPPLHNQPPRNGDSNRQSLLAPKGGVIKKQQKR